MKVNFVTSLHNGLNCIDIFCKSVRQKQFPKIFGWIDALAKFSIEFGDCKYQAIKYNGDIIIVIKVNTITKKMNTKVASTQVSLSFLRNPRNLFILALFLDDIVIIFFKCWGLQNVFNVENFHTVTKWYNWVLGTHYATLKNIVS